MKAGACGSPESFETSHLPFQNPRQRVWHSQKGQSNYHTFRHQTWPYDFLGRYRTFQKQSLCNNPIPSERSDQKSRFHSLRILLKAQKVKQVRECLRREIDPSPHSRLNEKTAPSSPSGRN